uniref:Uncharacterized protein n=1 Tax=Oryza punctata TaxID=4537 RepID=A0A0E0LVV7_ORYPU
MYNPEQQPPPHHQLMAPPRMSFSSDFALEPPPPPSSGPGRASMGDADFEFSAVGSRPMIAADQLFSKGRILPMLEASGGGGGGRTVTLRDELRGHDTAAIADRHRRTAQRPAGSGGVRWKEMLGLKRGHRKHGGAVESAEEGGASAHDLDHMGLVN